MKLLAYDITHLTDARYFSARGAHFIGYAAAHTSPEEVLAIMDWVDGPQHFLSWSSAVDMETIWAWTDRTGIQHVLLNEPLEDAIQQLQGITWMGFADRVPDYMTSDLGLLIHTEGGQGAPITHQGHEHYLLAKPDQPFDPNATHGFAGIAVSGSPESDIGWKDYADLDELLDQFDIEW